MTLIMSIPRIAIVDEKKDYIVVDFGDEIDFLTNILESITNPNTMVGMIREQDREPSDEELLEILKEQLRDAAKRDSDKKNKKK